MKYCSIVLILLVGLVMSKAVEEVDKIDTSWVSDETNCIVITSKQLYFNSQQGLAVFEGNVVVTSPELVINSERLTVFFAEDNKVDSIEAEGGVVIEVKQENEKIICFGQKSLYHVREGKVVLTGNPRIDRGPDKLKGEIITFWRDTGRIKCELGAELKLYSSPESHKKGSKKE